MRKKITVILALCLSLALLCACGSGAVVSGGNATGGNATDGNATGGNATDGNAAGTPAAADAAELTALLGSVRETYAPGTAGCSLKAAAYAAQLLDWFIGAGRDTQTVQTAAAALGTPGADENGVTWTDKLNDLYTAAVGLYGYYGEAMLESAGYEPVCWPYGMADVNAVFRTLYEAAQEKPPVYSRVFRGDENAERFIASAMEVQDVTAGNVVQALVDAGVLGANVKLADMTIDGGHIKLDLNAAFAQQLQGQGTAGETMLLGSVVNTFLSAFDAQDVLVTAGGRTLESGHSVYDMPLAFYADNVSAE